MTLTIAKTRVNIIGRGFQKEKIVERAYILFDNTRTELSDAMATLFNNQKITYKEMKKAGINESFSICKKHEEFLINKYNF